MLLFRSEEHIQAWYPGAPLGATLELGRQWDLARLWYEGRTSPDWRPRRPEEAQAIFDRLGLVGDFWRLSQD